MSAEAAPAADHVALVEQGGGRMLEIGGTSASWFQPGERLTGSVWDALALPIVALPEASRRELLVLGLGGGSAARLLRAAAPSAHLVGVEPLAEVVAAARESMELDAIDVDVRVTDARGFLEASGEPFDFILEDCFVGGSAGLAKPLWLCGAGLDAMLERLTPEGLLVIDTVQEDLIVCEGLRRRVPNVVRIELDDCSNRIFVASRAPLDARSLRRRARASAVFAGALPGLSFRTVVRGQPAMSP